jgi:hypothetical protein
VPWEHTGGCAPITFAVGRVVPMQPNRRGRGNASRGANPLSRRAAPAIRRRRHDRPCVGRGEPSRSARGRSAECAAHSDASGLDRGFLSENRFSVASMPVGCRPPHCQASSVGRARTSLALRPSGEANALISSASPSITAVASSPWQGHAAGGGGVANSPADSSHPGSPRPCAGRRISPGP